MVADCSQFFPQRYDHPDYQVPEYILLWGNNPVYSNSDGFLGHWVVELMKRGTKLITVDPRLTWLASKSEWFLQIRPGTGCSFALAIGNVICEEKLYNREFVEKWTDGFAFYCERVKDYPPEKRRLSAESMRKLFVKLHERSPVQKPPRCNGEPLSTRSPSRSTPVRLSLTLWLSLEILKARFHGGRRARFWRQNTWEGGWGAEMLSSEQKAKNSTIVTHIPS